MTLGHMPLGHMTFGHTDTRPHRHSATQTLGHTDNRPHCQSATQSLGHTNLQLQNFVLPLSILVSIGDITINTTVTHHCNPTINIAKVFPFGVNLPLPLFTF